jgi:murein endopeptidase
MRRNGLGSVLCALVLLGCSGAPAITARTGEGSLRAAAPAPGSPEPAAPAPDALHAEAELAETSDAPDDGEEVDDSLELAPELDAGDAVRSPLAGMTDAEVEERFRRDPSSLGPISAGSPNAGALLNGVQMPEDERWVLVDPERAWGTRETVDALTRAIGEVNRQFPGSPKLYVGHISDRDGGRLSPHRSHQAGRDVDISYFLDGRHRWYQRATAANLDRERTWAFLRALVTETDVELILIDSGVQRLLKEHALKIGEDREWLDDVFQVGSRRSRPLVRHARGHANHIHVRFYSPVAQESGVRVYPLLAKRGLARPQGHYVQHVARKGQTLGSLARRYGTTVEAIQRANGMRTTLIQARRVYNIPRSGSAGPAPALSPPRRLAVPPRRLPPAKAASGAEAPAAAHRDS